MRLLSLEIHGFKSFPDRTVLNFNEPVTAIVGPNGSGKSNISDAIRWVMGEQSNKALRGNKMDDVVFGGTSGRSPSGFAQVTLTLDNEDGTLPIEAPQVAVTRRVYRSGESEYYINRRSVRLKDINEMFMDTGLGKDGYSIIGQGRIDEILSVKSTQRRELFEEAAGISRYRSRREEALRRLEAAASNLVRINDKISELELQLDPLKEQAAAAEKYLDMRRELMGLECAVWLRELDTASAAEKESTIQAEETSGQLESARQALAGLYALAREEDENQRENREKADQLRQRVAELETEALSLENGAEMAVSGIEANRKNAAALREELADRLRRGEELRRQTAERSGEAERLASVLVTLDKEMRGVSAQAGKINSETDRVREEIRQLSVAVMTLSGDRAAAAARLDALKADGGSRTERLQRMEQQLNAARERRDEAALEADAARKALADAEQKVGACRNILRGCELKVSSREEEVERAVSRESAHKEGLGALRSRFGALSELERDYDGYSRAVKKIMHESEKGSLKRIRGPVSRLIEVRQEYVTAIQTALGASLQNIVVETREDAKAAIYMLKRTDSGRATFLPMDAVEGIPMVPGTLEKEPGFVDIASNLVTHAPEYDGIFSSLLGRTAVVEDLDSAIAISRKRSGKLRIVTLDGQVMNVGGSMTGGSTGSSGGILSRAAELSALRERIAGEESAMQELSAAREAAQGARDDAVRERDEAASALRSSEDSVLRLNGALLEKNTLLSGAEKTHEDAAQSVREEQQRSMDDRAFALELEKELSRADSELGELREQISGREEELRQLENSASELGVRQDRLRGEYAAADARRNAELTLTAEYEAMVRDTDSLRAETERRTAQLEEESAALAVREMDLREQAAERRKSAEELRGQFQTLTAETTRAESLRAQRQEEIQGRNDEVIVLERQAARIENRAAQAKMAQTQILDRMWDSYGLTRQGAVETASKIQSITAARQTVAGLKSRMEAMGTVNLGAVDEYARVSQRWEYLSGQRDDAQGAKKELENLIRSVSEDMKQVFLEKFAQINESFQETFEEIFGGGKAQVSLEDPEDVLECGIDIRVQPPGKKVRTLSLLSGGERAFAAIALYFAIIKIRPTPFCVLDEIETALDEINGIRFAEYLKFMSRRTQIIVITHRRPTMESAGVLYGVTMQTKGVSRVLALALDAVEEQLGQGV